jgi:parvulin-like peptidyl-prolyl isomerase
VQKQSQALQIRDEIHEGKITFNEAAFKYSEDKAGAHGLLGWKSQGELDQDFWAAALTCKEGDWLREPVKTQWGWHIIMVQGRKTMKKK